MPCTPLLRVSLLIPALGLSLFVLLAQVPVTEAEEKLAKKTKEVMTGDISLAIPESWKQKPQVREPRIAEFAIPAPEGEKHGGEVVVFFFGPRGAGGLTANIERWTTQFEPEGRKVRTLTGKCPQGKYTLVDLTGTYRKPMGPPIQMKSTPMPDWRVLNVFLETEAGPYFLKIDGPQKLVESVEDEFRAAFGGKQSDEEEREADAQ